MTPADIATLRGLCERATPGPWRQGSVETYNVFAPSRPDSEQLGHEWVVLRMNTHFPSYIADAAFVAAARQAVPALLDRVEELERERQAMRESLMHACELQRASHDNARQLWAIRQTANYLGEPFSHERVQAKYDEYVAADADATAARDKLAAECERLRALVNRAADSLDYCVQRHGEHSKSVRGDELRLAAIAKEGLT